MRLNYQKWIWQDPVMRLLLLVSSGLVILQFILFKYLYPYPNFLPDSYSYLDAAFQNAKINLWPVGYSKFLRLFSCFTHNDTALIFFQYAFLQAAVLYFLSSVVYITHPSKWFTRLLFAVSVLNPVLLYVSNFISSDAVFSALSIIWLTQIIWLTYSPGLKLVAAHAVVLYLVFITRYNALYYPIISTGVLLFSSLSLRKRLAGLGLIYLLIGSFITNTVLTYRAVSGKPQFSAFGNWQLASNALFAYAQQKVTVNEQVPDKFKGLHSIVIRHIDSLQQLTSRPDSSLGIYYLWDEKAPLKQFLGKTRDSDSSSGYFKRWIGVAPLYGEYGTFLIRQHPLSFTKHFLVPNIVNYYVPNPEFLAVYNMGSDSVGDIAKYWFRYTTNKVPSGGAQHIAVMELMPVAFAVVNLCFILTFLGFLVLGGMSKSSHSFRLIIQWITIIWGTNFLFSVFASPIVLRYQVFPIIFTFTFLLLLLEFLIKESSGRKPIINLPGYFVERSISATSPN